MFHQIFNKILNSTICLLTATATPQTHEHKQLAWWNARSDGIKRLFQRETPNQSCQDLVAKIGWPASGSQDLLARMC